MHMIKSSENSQFYSFSSNSDVARTIFNSKRPNISGEAIKVLQLSITDIGRYDTYIEFEYIKEIWWNANT